MISVPRQLLIQAFFILVNAIFAGLEMAMVSLSSTKLKMLEEEGDKTAIKLLKMLENPAGFLSRSRSPSPDSSAPHSRRTACRNR